MGQVLSVSEYSSRVSDVLLMLREEAAYDDQKEHEGALPEESLKETLL